MFALLPRLLFEDDDDDMLFDSEPRGIVFRERISPKRNRHFKHVKNEQCLRCDTHEKESESDKECCSVSTTPDAETECSVKQSIVTESDKQRMGKKRCSKKARNEWPILHRELTVPSLNNNNNNDDDLWTLKSSITPRNLFSFSKALGNINHEVYENEKEYVYVMDLPGVAKDNIVITHDNNSCVHISVERKETMENKDEHGYKLLSQSSAYSMERSFSVPQDAAVSQMSVSLKHGILKISIPKSKESKNETIVQISSDE